MEKSSISLSVGNITVIEVRQKPYKSFDDSMQISYKSDIVVDGIILTDFKISKEVFESVGDKKMVLGTDAVFSLTAYKGTPTLTLTGFKVA